MASCVLIHKGHRAVFCQPFEALIMQMIIHLLTVVPCVTSMSHSCMIFWANQIQTYNNSYVFCTPVSQCFCSVKKIETSCPSSLYITGEHCHLTSSMVRTTQLEFEHGTIADIQIMCLAL